MKRILSLLTLLALAGASSLLASPAKASAEAGADTDIPRSSNGRPDLSGTYDIATLTPLVRPAELGDNLYMTPERLLDRPR